MDRADRWAGLSTTQGSGVRPAGWRRFPIIQPLRHARVGGTQVRKNFLDVAHAAGVTDVSAITDAGAYAYTTMVVGPFCDADCDVDGVGEFVVWRNDVGFYGALRVDDIDLVDPDVPLAELDATWWFQPDGSPNLADSIVGGSSDIGTVTRVQCSNRTTGQVVNIFPAGVDDWDCEAGGLIVSSGDKVRMTVLGSVG